MTVMTLISLHTGDPSSAWGRAGRKISAANSQVLMHKTQNAESEPGCRAIVMLRRQGLMLILQDRVGSFADSAKILHSKVGLSSFSCWTAAIQESTCGGAMTAGSGAHLHRGLDDNHLS